MTKGTEHKRRRVSPLKAAEELLRETRADLADQAVSHHVEMTELVAEYIAMKDALRYAVGLLQDVRDHGKEVWTPAHDAMLVEWRAMVSRLAGVK